VHSSSFQRRAKKRFDDQESPSYYSRGGRRFGDDEDTAEKRDLHRARLAGEDAFDSVDGLPDGDRWSTWDQSSPTERGPEPYPDWLVTDLGATDTELGILKTGKEADVYLLRRGVPGTDRSCLLAAKRYRSSQHRQFHRDVGYLEGRRVRESRVNRAMAGRTTVGRAMISQQWASAEFDALRALHQAGVRVPYPVQIVCTEILLEFIGDEDGAPAPRLAETRPSEQELITLWNDLVGSLRTLAGLGLAHGDLSAYNLLAHQGQLVMIDLPQVVDVVAHPRGAEFLVRDVANVTTWFLARGLADQPPAALTVLPGDLLADLSY
jgi:RIO kinase 1